MEWDEIWHRAVPRAPIGEIDANDPILRGGENASQGEEDGKQYKQIGLSVDHASSGTGCVGSFAESERIL
jgi:hypothetical protein